MENYEVLEPLGTGSFGRVCKISRKSDKKILVWKELHYATMSEREKHQIVAEVNILRDLRHPNIVRYYDRVIEKQSHKIFIVQEYCEGGDLLKFIKKHKKEKQSIPEDLIWKWFMQIILALHEIHTRKDGKILHRDLKPANIFLDANNNVKLGDFGLAKILDLDKDFAETKVGTPYYMSPEQIIEKKYNEKSDIWALGCLLYELCSLSPPFEATNHLSLALKIKSGKFDRIPPVYSNELQRVIQWILSLKVTERPNVDELLNVPEISMRLRDKRVKDTRAGLKKKEEDLRKREEELGVLERGLRNRMVELEERERRLVEEERKMEGGG
jgi:serine/threonine protein kinase